MTNLRVDIWASNLFNSLDDLAIPSQFTDFLTFGYSVILSTAMRTNWYTMENLCGAHQPSEKPRCDIDMKVLDYDSGVLLMMTFAL